MIFGIVNTMVSLKYETNNPNECISLVTGQDLCKTVMTMKIIIGFCFVGIIAFLGFKKRLLKQN